MSQPRAALRNPAVLRTAADLNPALIEQVAAGRAVVLDNALAGRVDAICAAARRQLADGRLVYGVSTGLGALSGVRLSQAEQREHQRNLLLARATGGPPWLAPQDVRALFAVRLRTFLSGDAGVSAALCRRLADFLAAGIMPAVPWQAAGSAGEIVPLAHAFGPLAGIGRVLAPAGAAPGTAAGPRSQDFPGTGAAPGHPARPDDGSARDSGAVPGHPARPDDGSARDSGAVPEDSARPGDGRWPPYGSVPDDAGLLAGAGLADLATEPAAGALERHGLSPFALGPKEGIALLAGVPGATALSLLDVAQAARVTAMMTATAALSIAAVGAPADPYAAAGARGDEVLAAVLGRLRAALGTPGRAARMLQAPVSFRVAGPVLAQVTRAAAALAEAVERALAGVTDSPAFTGDRFLGTAGFHGIDLAAHCDQLTAALAHAAEVSAARAHRLLDPRVTGLPAQLAVRPGPDTGLVAVHKRAAGEVHALRQLAVPSSLGLIETSNGQEDVQSFAWAAALGLRAALRHARLVTACELLMAYQAACLADRDRPAADAGGWPGGNGLLLAELSRLIPPVTADRPFGEDIERLATGSWPALSLSYRPGYPPMQGA